MESAPDVQFREDLHLFVWRPRGILDEAAVNKVLLDLFRRETMAAKPFNRFSDLSLVESFHLTFKYVFHVALHRRLSYIGRERIKSAFYVTHPEAAHLVKIHALVTDLSPLDVEIFEEREAAAKWLCVPVELLLPTASPRVTQRSIVLRSLLVSPGSLEVASQRQKKPTLAFKPERRHLRR
jgi:hypothetical protein